VCRFECSVSVRVRMCVGVCESLCIRIHTLHLHSHTHSHTHTHTHSHSHRASGHIHCPRRRVSCLEGILPRPSPPRRTQTQGGIRAIPARGGSGICCAAHAARYVCVCVFVCICGYSSARWLLHLLCHPCCQVCVCMCMCDCVCVCVFFFA
jgi:hypothetical protein